MPSRLAALSVLGLAGLIAWLTVTSVLAARLLQIAVGISVVYVAYLAWRGGWVMGRERARGRSGAGIATGAAAGRPWITLVVPARNEAAVITATVVDLLAQEYADATGPRFDLLVVDDGSSDGTGDLARAAADLAGDRARVVRRDPEARPRTKAAALAYAEPFVRGEVVGVIDADTRVESDFLDRVVRAWEADPDAAAIQAQRRAADAALGWLWSAQDSEQLMDMAGQCGRRAGNGAAELRGNGMFVRTVVLLAVGGWNPEALTEDLDLSARLTVAGYHVALAPDAVLREQELSHFADLWRQRLRWAEGGLRRMLEVGPALLRSRSVPLGRKLDFVAFGAEYLIPPMFVAAILASLITIPMPGTAEWTVPLSLLVAYGSGTLLLALAGLASDGARGALLLGRSLRGALFLSHWLLVVPVALGRIAVGRPSAGFVQTPRQALPPV